MIAAKGPAYRVLLALSTHGPLSGPRIVALAWPRESQTAKPSRLATSRLRNLVRSGLIVRALFADGVKYGLTIQGEAELLDARRRESIPSNGTVVVV